MSIWSGLFWKDTVERVISTAAQTLIAILSINGLSLASIDPVATLSAVVIASVLVVLKALAANARSGTGVSPASLAQDNRGI